jgi:flagellar basal body-associated protein FliL
MRKIVRNKSKKLVIIVGIIVVVCSIGGYVLFKNSNTQEISPQEVSISENQEPEPDAVVQESVETTPAVAEETAPTLPVAEEAEPTWPVLLTQSEAA